MTDINKLKEVIKQNGVSFSFIADKIGMTRQGLFNKLNPENGEKPSDFKAWQMLVIVDILHLSDEDARTIFFANDVGKKST